MTEKDLVQRAYEALRLRRVAVGESDMVRMARLAPSALETFSKRVLLQPGFEGYQTDFDVPVVNGFADLNPETGILFDIERSKVKLAATGEELTAVRDLWRLQKGDWPRGIVYFAQEGSGLRIRAADGTLTTFASDLKVKSNYVMTLSDGPGADAARPVPLQGEGGLALTLAELAFPNLPAPPETSAAGRA